MDPISHILQKYPGAVFENCSVCRQHANYCCNLKVLGWSFHGEGVRIKLARKVAAEKALAVLQKKCKNPEQPLSSELLCKARATLVSEICEAKYAELSAALPHRSKKLSKVTAAVVKITKGSIPGCEQMQVVALGTGTKSVGSPHLTRDGTVLLDCHAEVIARRGLLRFLYDQLGSYCHRGETVFERQNDGKLCLKEGVSFHLYISTVPCGDARVFTARPDGHSGRHSRGKARVKIDAGAGTVLADDQPQTWEGIKSEAVRLMIMSCSDKVARWNVIGIQGSLLSLYIEPIYFESITIGSDLNEEHMFRAISLRIGAVKVPHPFSVHAPFVYKPSVSIAERSVDAPDSSLNWTLGDKCPELVRCQTGICEDGSTSRLSKVVFYGRFIKLWDFLASKEVRSNLPFTTSAVKAGYLQKHFTYKQMKEVAILYQKAKAFFSSHFRQYCGSQWIKKPPEIDTFSLS